MQMNQDPPLFKKYQGIDSTKEKGENNERLQWKYIPYQHFGSTLPDGYLAQRKQFKLKKEITIKTR